jgi:hypothetical protein
MRQELWGSIGAVTQAFAWFVAICIAFLAFIFSTNKRWLRTVNLVSAILLIALGIATFTANNYANGERYLTRDQTAVLISELQRSNIREVAVASFGLFEPTQYANQIRTAFDAAGIGGQRIMGPSINGMMGLNVYIQGASTPDDLISDPLYIGLRRAHIPIIAYGGGTSPFTARGVVANNPNPEDGIGKRVIYIGEALPAS